MLAQWANGYTLNPSAVNLQRRTKIFGTVMENLASTSLTYQTIKCSIVSLTTWMPRMALPSPSKQCWDEGESVQGCTNYNIAWGRGRKGEKLRHIVLIVLRVLSPIVDLS